MADDSLFLSKLNLIDYSLLLLKIKDLAPGETDDSSNDALQIDEDGNFQLKRTSKTIGNRVKRNEEIQDDTSSLDTSLFSSQD